MKITAVVVVIAVLGLWGLSSCGKSGSERRAKTAAAAAIEHVIKEDARLAAIRDTQADKSPAEAIRSYARAMKQIDLRNAPPEMQEAYLKHANAWARAASFVDKYSGWGGGLIAFLEGVSGSTAMEDSEARVGKEIEDTWLEVEKIALKYGIHPNQ